MENKELAKFQIPEGYTAKIEGNEVRVVKIEGAFRDGDFVVSENFNCPFIYKGTDNTGFHLYYAGLNISRVLIMGNDEVRFGNGPLRAATAEEKQEFEDALAGKGLFWNAKEKRFEKKRWRAEYDEVYYYLGLNGEIYEDKEMGCVIDYSRYNYGNYFRTREQAERVAMVVKETLKKFHEENC